MEEFIEVRFANDEKDFIYNKGVNKGYYQSYPKIGRNYFLSSSARALYELLNSYASYNDKRECFPSRETIKAELGGWGNDKFSKAVDELEKGRLIDVHQRRGKSSLYHLVELHHSTVIAHSELVHLIKQELKEEGKIHEFYKHLTKYRASDLYNQVAQAQNPLSFSQDIRDWFHSYMEETPQPPKEKPKKEEKRNIPFIGAMVLDSEKTSVKSVDPLEEPKIKKKKSRNPLEVDVAEWNTNHFVSYFEKVWLEKKGLPYPTNMKADLSMMKNVILHTGNNEVVKTMIEKYFELDTNATKHSIMNFSSSFIQQRLINELNSSSSTSYKSNAKKSTDMQVDDDWLANLKD